jgi:hypothetical protein
MMMYSRMLNPMKKYIIEYRPCHLTHRLDSHHSRAIGKVSYPRVYRVKFQPQLESKKGLSQGLKQIHRTKKIPKAR